MRILDKPLSKEEILDLNKKEDYIRGVVRVGLDELVNNDLEGFVDLISMRLIDSPLLMDVGYRVVGADINGCVLIEIIGDASEIIEYALN